MDDKLPRSRFQKRSLQGTSSKNDDDISTSLTTSCWCPRPSIVFNVLLSARLTSSFFSNISDCDETYNYWEPTHYMLYGDGFQTWEYSPTYAIRSYAYLYLHLIPAQLLKELFKANKITVFYYIRFILSIICAACETYFYKSLMTQFNNHVARLYFVFAALSTGMFISASAYLPSSFAMYCCLIAFAGWFNGNHFLAIFGIALGSLVGWPFFAVLGIPIAFDLVIRRHLFRNFILWAACIFVAIMIPLVAIDTHYYGKTVVAPLNIVLYNVFGKGGPDLYGVESWSFYFINGFLNFNVIFFMALVSLPFCLLASLKYRHNNKNPFKIPLWLSLSALYIWVIIFFTRPHKEERFLFPVYPLLLFNGCILLSKFQEVYHMIFSSKSRGHYSDSSNWFVGLVIIVFSLLSLSRSSALYVGYHAPLDVYPELHDLVRPIDQTRVPVYSEEDRINVCVGREWYRYPSSFFLPQNWNYMFIKSEFAGQLPQPYQDSPDATKVIPPNMNDMNLEEHSRYTSIKQCQLLIDVDIGEETEHEPNYSKDTKNWKVIYSSKFMDTSKSHRLFRAFYVPFISSKYTSYINYNLLKRIGKSNKKRKVDRNL